VSFSELAHILQRRDGEVYVHYVNTDKRMDEWVPEESCRCDSDGAQLPQAEITNRKRKRKRDVSYPSALNGFTLRGYGEDKGSPMPTEIVMTEEDFDLQHHQQLRAQRNFDVVIFDVWKIKPW
jgi:histone acetyltransferase MYST1